VNMTSFIRYTKLCAVMLLFFTGCTEKAAPNTGTVRPLPHMEVITIHSPGVVKILKGDVLLRKENSNQYTKVYPSFLVNFGDMIELTKGASIKIVFQNETPITIQPVDKDTWYIFQKSVDTKKK
jgi:hypothetical protein